MSKKEVVIWTNPDGTVTVTYPSPGVDPESLFKIAPEGGNPKVVPVDAEHFPLDGTYNEEGVPNVDRTFRKAWKQGEKGCFECPVKSKEVAHEIRRTKRAEEFAPYDEVVSKRLQGEIEAEAQRQLIREKYAKIQQEIDAAKDVESLKKIIT